MLPLAYIFKRLLLLVPTIFIILLINFIVAQFVPGGPIDKYVSRYFSSDAAVGESAGHSHGKAVERELSQRDKEEFIKEMEREFGFDKPVHVRFYTMIVNYLRFNLGNSFFRDIKVLTVIKEKLPVSVSLGLWSTLLIYMISVPIGIAKALKNGAPFDTRTTFMLTVMTAIPTFLLGMLFIVLFSVGDYLSIFPLRGLFSLDYANMNFWQKVGDYIHHITLPVLCLTLGGFAFTTFLTKNYFLEEISKQYVVTARSKGASERRILYGHVFRNAMLILIAGVPATFLRIFFTGNIVIEALFSLDGMSSLIVSAIYDKDFPLFFGSLYIVSIVGLLAKIITDISYTFIDPRINFNALK